MLKLNAKEKYEICNAVSEISSITADDVNGWLYYGTVSDMRECLQDLSTYGMTYDSSDLDDDSSSDEHIFYGHLRPILITFLNMQYIICPLNINNRHK